MTGGQEAVKITEGVFEQAIRRSGDSLNRRSEGQEILFEEQNS
jgi:hypothetical protein